MTETKVKKMEGQDVEIKKEVDGPVEAAIYIQGEQLWERNLKVFKLPLVKERLNLESADGVEGSQEFTYYLQLTEAQYEEVARYWA